MVDFLPSKQIVWVQVSLSAFLNSEYSADGSAPVLGIGGHVFNSHYSDNNTFS